MTFYKAGGVIYPTVVYRPLSHSKAVTKVTYGDTDDKILIISTPGISRHSLCWVIASLGSVHVSLSRPRKRRGHACTELCTPACCLSEFSLRDRFSSLPTWTKMLWLCARVRDSLVLVPQIIDLTWWHWQGQLTVSPVLKLSTLSKQQTQLHELGISLWMSAGVWGFHITDMGLWVPGKCIDPLPRFCLSSSVNISIGSVISGNVAAQISHWNKENQRPCQHCFDWVCTQQVSQSSLKGLSPLAMETQQKKHFISMSPVSTPCGFRTVVVNLPNSATI